MRGKHPNCTTVNLAKASEALAYIRMLCAVEKEIVDDKLASDIAVSLSQTRAGSRWR